MVHTTTLLTFAFCIIGVALLAPLGATIFWFRGGMVYLGWWVYRSNSPILYWLIVLLIWAFCLPISVLCIALSVIIAADPNLIK